MKGFEIKIQLYGIYPQISRELILPEKTTFPEFQKIICKLFSLDNETPLGFWHDTEFDGYIDPKNFLVEKYIYQKFYFEHYDFNNKEVWYEVTLNRVVDYDRNYATITNYSGDFNLDKIQEELKSMTILRNRAYDIIINCEKTKEVIKREFLIPEKTTFNQLEKIIMIAFDTKPISFERDDVLVDDCFKKSIKIYSQNKEFNIDVKKRIYSDKRFPLLINYEGGLNPFDLWWEYYPKVPVDECQCSLDDFINTEEAIDSHS
ncbi:plasmid pRiA4b ORF-3 family protein [Methanobrevibacter millerae]|uniref:PRiA4b ORF-3-like protein n=1 Tax=Methanobrevibacter millerae TaxID=230361 RepID=A0A1G5VJ77_9EURY|nr:plasmid pRiA4b ORF-3 family protein [Methanobrevibacter millerae]SDA45115.1 pRiA4b ORF-3-like protein [Methanobrevibacter millerae]